MDDLASTSSSHGELSVWDYTGCCDFMQHLDDHEPAGQCTADLRTRKIWWDLLPPCCIITQAHGFEFCGNVGFRTFRAHRIWAIEKPPFRLETNGRLNRTFQLWRGHRLLEEVGSAVHRGVISSNAGDSSGLDQRSLPILANLLWAGWH